MNKEKFNQSVDKIEVPLEKLLAREKQAISRVKKDKRAGRIKKQSWLVAYVFCLSILGFGFVSTNMAEALSNMPLIGPIYIKILGI